MRSGCDEHLKYGKRAAVREVRPAACGHENAIRDVYRAAAYIYVAAPKAPGRAWWGTLMTAFARFLVAAAILGVATASCSEGQPQQAKGPPPPPTVTVAKPARKLVVDEDEYVGRFLAVDSVEIRARVGGYLEK